MEKDELSRFAKEIASRRRTDVEHECLYCGKVFVGMAKARYCSPSHRQADYLRRKEVKDSPDA
jgi:hypothetical protein